MSQIWAPLAEGQRPGIYVPGQFIYLQGTQADTFFDPGQRGGPQLYQFGVRRRTGPDCPSGGGPDGRGVLFR